MLAQTSLKPVKVVPREVGSVFTTETVMSCAHICDNSTAHVLEEPQLSLLWTLVVCGDAMATDCSKDSTECGAHHLHVQDAILCVHHVLESATAWLGFLVGVHSTPI